MTTDLERMDALLDELKGKYVPDESRQQSQGQLGFDYGYHQALAEVRIRLFLVFPEWFGAA